jgi:hypothetical protein
MPESLFTPADGGRWLPTDFARGPWSPDALHGGPTSALLAREAEPLLEGMVPVRLTVELLRPVPVAPLSIDATLVRPGKKVRLVAVSLRDGDVEVASATVLAIRRADVDVPAHERPSLPAPPSEGVATPPRILDYDAFHNCGVEHRFVAGSFDEPGPATDWIRLHVPVVPGEEPSGLQRVAAAADFGNGISRFVDFEKLLFINPDLTVYLHREMVGEWVCLDATSILEPNGTGLAQSQLFDEQGVLGRSLQSLLVDAR